MEMNSTPTGRAEEQENTHLHNMANENNVKMQEAEEEDDDEEPETMEKPKKSWHERMHDCKLLMWNPEKGEFMGRTGKSWALILLFYFVLYAFLAGLFGLCLYVMLLTISPYTPTYRDRVCPPGVMIRPSPPGFEFNFNISERHTWSSYVEQLHSFLEPYNDSVQAVKNKFCNSEDYIVQKMKESAEMLACQFNRSMLESCSGISDTDFGYSVGKPCILLKMNRIIGYKPGHGKPIAVTCEIQRGDETAIEELALYPGNGTFKLMYFPYYGKLIHLLKYSSQFPFYLPFYQHLWLFRVIWQKVGRNEAEK
ncbi:protein ATP1B4 isoform X2 [Protopterus annectens]|uniref:protein ATP1B4 isoform X2 n=1 Tax=Protopterus annectens TaxID=7888 RepID=UPI001CF9A19F|nr:protein ATP1B4 isoform X2 [Protopterus annectens]